MKNILVSTGLTVIILLILVLCIGCSNSEYQTITIGQLVTDITAYDGQKIMVEGLYSKAFCVIPGCIPIGTGENPVIKGDYSTYPCSPWRIESLARDRLVAVFVVDTIKDGKGSSSYPNYKEGQEIKLKGIARATTFQFYCDRDVRYRSLYIEVKAEDIPVTWKKLPKETPPIILPQTEPNGE